MVLHLEASPATRPEGLRRDLHMCAAITEATCSDDGAMRFRSQTVARQRVKHAAIRGPRRGCPRTTSDPGRSAGSSSRPDESVRC